MAKNIMLSFLSPLQGGEIKEYEELAFDYAPESGSVKTACQTNEAPIYDVHEFLAGRGEKLDAMFAFATERVKEAFVLEHEGDRCSFDGILPFLLRRCAEQGIGFEHCQLVDYDAEAENPVEESLSRAACMAGNIKAYLGDKAKWSEAHIFVDITGGFRYANMIMMTVVRLLQYDGMQVDKIIYSEKTGKCGRVFDFRELNRMYSLAAGADAFVKYGRSQAIEEYFGFDSSDKNANHHLTAELSKLLRAMHTFSDSISLCRTATLLKDMRELGRALDSYANQEHPVEEAAFAQLLDTIYREYEQILVKDIESYVPKMLDVIDWCLKKGFVQQALTLSNEWLPIYIVQMKICYPADSGINKSTSTLHHHWEQEFIINFIPPRKMIDGLGPVGEIISAWAEGRKVHIDEAVLPDKFVSFLKTVEEAERLHRKFLTFGRPEDRGGLRHYMAQHGEVDRMLDFFYRRMPATYQKNYATFIHTYGYKRKLMVFLHGMGKKQWQELFLEKEEQPDIKPGPKTYWSEREKQWRKMFSAGVAASCVEVEEAIGLLYHHNKLRQLRHNTNHASEENNYTAEDIKTAIAAALADFYRVTGKLGGRL